MTQMILLAVLTISMYLPLTATALENKSDSESPALLTILAVDLGTSVRVEERENILKAFLALLQRVWTETKSSDDNYVAVVTPVAGTTSWEGTAKQFRKGKMRMLERVFKLDYPDFEHKSRHHYTSNIKAMFQKISELEIRQADDGLITSKIFILSPLIDTVNIPYPFQEEGKWNRNEINRLNRETIASYIGELDNQPADRTIYSYWVNEAVIDIARNAFDKLDNTTVADIGDPRKTESVLDQYAPPISDPKAFIVEMLTKVQ